MILSGEPMPSDRKRRRYQDPVMIVPDNRPAPPVPAPSAEPSLRDVMDYLKQSEARREERHAELLKKIAEATDAIQGNGRDIEELRAATHAWLQQVIDAVDELDDPPFPV